MFIYLAHAKHTGHTHKKKRFFKNLALCFSGELRNFAFYFLSFIKLFTMVLHMSTCFVYFGTMKERYSLYSKL
jgi:hypothetical protein